jgi:aminoglycoside 3-N-acetyltransferase
MAVLVHCSMRQVGLVEGGAECLRDALLDVLGEEHGTLVVSAQTPSVSATSRRFKEALAGLDSVQREAYLRDLPGFDPRTSPAEGVGVLAESVRTHDRAQRSPHPITSFAAVGRHAAEICASHPLECLLGAQSPLGRLSDLKGRVLLLGVGFDACTAFHLGETAVFSCEQDYRCKISGKWRNFTGFEYRDHDFIELGEKFEQAHAADISDGRVGDCRARLFPLHTAAEFAAMELPGLRSRH